VFDMLEDELGLRIECTADTIDVSDLGARHGAPESTCCVSTSAGGQ